MTTCLDWTRRPAGGQRRRARHLAALPALPGMGVPCGLHRPGPRARGQGCGGALVSPRPAATTGSTMLEVKALHAGYGGREVLSGVSLTVPAGTVVALHGAAGAGKTTLLRAIAGELTPTRGAVLLDGRPTGGRSAATLARLGLHHLPQGPKAFAPRPVEELLLLAAASRPRGLFGIGARPAADLGRTYQLLPGLAARRARQADTLSGGEAQLLDLGRALMARPRVLLLDEPTAGVSAGAVGSVLEAIRRLRSDGVAILLVGQAGQAALELADQAWLLEHGQARPLGGAAEAGRPGDAPGGPGRRSGPG